MTKGLGWNLLDRVWGSSPEPETDEEKSKTDEYDNPRVYFTSQGERYVYPDDLMGSRNAQSIVKKFQKLAAAQNLETAQGISRSSSEE